MKRCQDVQDLERWLKASGYRRVQVLGLACRPLFSTLYTGGEPSSSSSAVPAVAEKTRQAGEAEASNGQTQWNPVASLLETDLSSMLGGPFAARRERALSDCEMAVEVSKDVCSDDPQALKAAKLKLGTAISDAIAAGVKERDLKRAREREAELQGLIDARGGLCFLCCRSGAKVEQHAAEAAATPTPIPRLRPGTKCRYDSATKKSVLSAVVQEFNESDCTYDLDVRPHAQPEFISPDPRASESDAWPAGTLVDYTSRARGRTERAVITSFNEGRFGNEGTYNLDVCRQVPVAEIRPRR